MSRTSFAVRADNARTQIVGRRQGQVVIMFALCLTVLLLLLGGALDFAGITIEKGRLQNAADSAALAAAQTLDDGGDKPSASATAMAFLSSNGYPSSASQGCVQNCAQIAYPTPSVGGVGNPQGTAQVADVSVGHPYQTSFWGLVGLPTVNLQVDAQASSSGRRFDIFVSIDESFSMSDDDMAQLRRAAHLFVQTLNPATNDPYSPKVAIAAFQGVRYTAEYSDMSTGRYTVAGLADSLILTHLTNNARDLYHLIDGDTTIPGCPYFSMSADQPWMPYTVFPPTREGQQYGRDGVYTGGYDPNKQGIYVEGIVTPYAESPSHVPSPPFTQFACPLRQDPKGGTSGRFIRNAITAAFVPSVWDPFPLDSSRHPRGQQRNPLATWDAFSWQHGGRDGLKSDGVTPDPAPPAKRVLIVMTDGQNTYEPIPPGAPCAQMSPDGTSAESQCGALNNQSFARYDPAHMQPASGSTTSTGTDADSVTVQAATAAKLGPDGSSAPGKTADDIEIYTIGFYGHNESGLTSASAPPMCPAPVLTAGMQSQMQRADNVLLGVSSSSPNSCDHYFPVDKSTNQGLATIFASIAGRIKRAQLVN